MPDARTADSPRGSAADVESRLRDARQLYAMYFFAAWGDRMWQFATIVFIMELFPNTLLPSSLFGFFESVAGLAFGAAAGAFVDHHDRLTVIRASIGGQNVPIVLASAALAYAIANMDAYNQNARWAVVAVVIVAGMMAKVASSINKISLHKDWCVVVSGGVSSVQTLINANMRRADMICSIGAPLAVGALSALINPAPTCVVIAAWAVVSLGIEMILSGRVFHSVTALQTKPVKVVEPHASPLSPEGKKAKQNWFTHQAHILNKYWHHRAFAVSLPYALLYISILSLSGTMVSYLRTLGVADFWLAVGRALGAVTGMIATFATPVLVKRHGLIESGFRCLWAQIGCLAPLVIMFIAIAYVGIDYSMWMMIIIFGSTASSRFGLWGFDLAQTQLMQELIEHEQAGAINGAQETVINVCYLMSYTLTVVFDDPAHFVYPAVISYTSIFVAGLLFTRYRGSPAAAAFQREQAEAAARELQLTSTEKSAVAEAKTASQSVVIPVLDSPSRPPAAGVRTRMMVEDPRLVDADHDSPAVVDSTPADAVSGNVHAV